MEESSEAHMESDVSSTTDDSQSAPEGPAVRCDLDTVIVIETEDDNSPTKNKSHEIRSPDHNEIVKFVPKSSQELTVKKIIIKSPVNPNAKPVQKSPVKSDEAAKTVGKSSSPVKSSTQATESAVDSSKKSENQGSPAKNVDKDEQNSLTESSENQTNIPKPLNADTQNKEVVPMEVDSKNSPNKEQVSIKISPVKDQPISVSPCRDQLVKVVPIAKESPPGKIPGKEAPIKIFLSRELVRSSPIKEIKSTLVKETKTTPAKEVQTLQIKPTPHKEGSHKITVIKETPPKTHKENSAKQVTPKELTIKPIPIKESTPNKTTTKEGPAKLNAIKEPPLKIVPVRDTPKPSTTEPTETEIKTHDITLEDKEVSNDSQLETNSDTSEREHNKSISRELRSLINSAKESKIISECTQLTSKTRKSRTPLDTSISNLNASVEADKIQGARRSSDNSQKSNCSSEKSEKPQLKRSMRSQNPEFVSKVKNFLNSVSGKIQKPETEATDEDVVEKDKEEPKEKKENEELTPSLPKKKKADDVQVENNGKLRVDAYCWRCHWAVAPAPNEKVHAPMQCSVCPRGYHYKCLTGPERSKINLEKNWVCPECLLILQAESSESRSPAMKKISLGKLCDLLRHALERMMEVNGVEPFTQPVDRTAFPDYDKYVVHPMDLSLMRRQIDEGVYGSTEAFLSDCQWILHNSIIFNTLQAKLTGGARALVRSCRAEMSEIEACPECYAAAHARRPTWFTDVCTTPHILLWAKLKGFPYWPAKGMSVNCSGLVDVRFFGAHDRAWVPARDCFLYSEKDPNNFRTKRQDILDSMQEAEQHIRNISRKYGKFVYPPFKTQFEPTKLYEQLKLMIPSFEGEVRSAVNETTKGSPSSSAKDKSRSNSKSSKGSANDGDISESEEPAAAPRKMADGAEIAREEDDSITEKDKAKPMEVEIPHTKDNEATRKRRRSEMEEAVITIIDSSKEKRKRVEPEPKVEEKKDGKETVKQENKEPNKKETPKSKETEPSTSTDAKGSPKVTPIRVISISKVLKTTKMSPKNTPAKEDEKTPAKQKKVDKVVNDKEKLTPQEDKKTKRRNSKNRSLNNSNTGKVDKTEKKKETDAKEKAKDSNVANKNNTEVEKSVKDRVQFDDDTSLAVLAREVRSASSGSMPTISSVRSLSTAARQDKSLQTSADSSVFTPTSTENVKNMREAVNKLQKIRGENDPPPPPVGRVGVRAFARMTSPSTETRPTEEVEIKTEPIDIEESERHMQEKMDLMNAFKLRPVNPTNLREVRINKVVVTPVARKAPTQPPQIRPRAKKTFPQPKKADEGRSELTCKNSMVYIPIQPPMTQAPARPVRPVVSTASAAAAASTQRTIATHNNSIPNNLANHSLVNTVTSPLVPSTSTFTSPTSSVPTSSNSNTSGAHTVGQVPTTVHTMPLITSVNGQWTFSLQPVLSVGGVDNAPSPPILNGIPPDRVVGVVGAASPALLPAAAAPLALAVPAAPAATPAVAPAAAPAPAPAPAPPAAPSTPAAPAANNNSTPATTPQSSNTPLPKLQQRPSFMNPLDANAPVCSVPPPSTVGPLTAKLNQNAVKMTDFFRALLEDSLEKLDEPAAQVTALKLQLEQAQWRHLQEVNEIKHNHELTIAEMRSSFEKDKIRLVAETRRQTQVELDDAVKQAKSKQWCANCNQEAQFYCCWNTSYCDYPCQRAHWAQHYAVCTQQRQQDNNSGDRSSNPPESRLQQAPENLPKTTAAPNLTMANKLAPSRIYTAQDQSPKPSIIVSMVEDNSGNTTMKCLGTYKPPSAPGAQVGSVTMSPLIINKQLMTSEEAAKKVVTSGGYLIVGAPNSVPISSSMTMTPARRAPAIQYIS